MIPNVNSFDVRQYHRSSMGPNWRVQLVSSPPTRSFRRMNGQRDPTVRALQDYLGLTAKKGWAAARAKFPLIALAEDLEQDPIRRGSARLMILAGAASEEMSERLGVSVPAIQVWESLYFDVRDLQHAMAWLSTHVIKREQDAGNSQLAARLKVAATAGPEAARALLDGPLEVPGDEAERLFRRNLNLQTKLEEASEMPVESNREKFQFVKYYGRLLMARKRIELAGARLAEKRAAAQRRHELALRRLELKRQAERSVKGQATGPGPRKAAKVEGDQEQRELAKDRRRPSPRAGAARAAESPPAKRRRTSAMNPDPPPGSKAPKERRNASVRRPKIKRPGKAVSQAARRNGRRPRKDAVQTCDRFVEMIPMQSELVLTV
jgi:hypothetical protein